MRRSVRELIPVLQIAIGPVILVSGVGLVLPTMTDRPGRVNGRCAHFGASCKACREWPADRPRAVGDPDAPGRDDPMGDNPGVLERPVSGCARVVLFITALFHREEVWLTGLLFGGCMLTLIGAMIAFIYDVNQSLAELKFKPGDERVEG